MERLSPLHELIVCAYKDSPFLPECLESLVNQDSGVSRVLVCTSTPSEYIYSVSNSYGVEVLVNHNSRGIASDWNFALDSARTDFVTVCHQDDVYDVSYSSKMMELMMSYPEILIGLCGNSECTKSGVRPVKLNLRVKKALHCLAFLGKKVRSARKVRYPLLSFGNPVCCPGVVINRRMLFDFRFCSNFKSNLDWEAWDAICKREGDVAYISDLLVSHRVHEGSETSVVIADKTRVQEDLDMFRRYWPDFLCGAIMFLYRFSYRGNRLV